MLEKQKKCLINQYLYIWYRILFIYIKVSFDFPCKMSWIIKNTYSSVH